MTEGIDWAQIFVKYRDLVANYEGLDFLDEDDWSDDDWAAIKTVVPFA